ncbi:MAG: nitroreductase family protein [Chloroflexi bacterium]|nr:nitroreductase family protein [Chloroflexota bacterium]
MADPLSGDPLAFLRERRSVRRFTPQPLARECIESVLAAATFAPSAHNRQPWRFVVVEDLAARQRLAEEMGAAFRDDLAADGLDEAGVEAQVQRSISRIAGAPALILLCLDEACLDAYPDERRQQAERLMGVQSAAMAGQNLLLAAHVLGLGAVWMCAPLFAPQIVRSALGLPAAWQPQGMILLGYPAEAAKPRPRKSVDEVSRFV